MTERDLHVETMELAYACRTPLEARQIPFALEQRDAEPSAAARCVLLGDGAGRIQLLVSRDRFVDLRALQNASGRELRASHRDDRTALCAQLGLSELPGIPLANDTPMWIDNALLQAKEVYLPSGAGQQWIRVDQSAFARLTSDCRVVDGSRPTKLAVQDDGGRASIDKAVEQFTTLRIRERLDDTLHVPPLPDAARRIIQLQLDPDYDLTDLIRIVEGDAAIAAQVVGLASSPMHRARSAVTSVEDAIMRVLGVDMVVNLALGLAISQSLRVPAGFEGGVFRYWLQSVYAGATAEALARCMPRKGRVPPGIAYLCGLLHNFGFLVLAHVFPPHFQVTMAHRAANDHLLPSLVEQELLGISGEQVAGALLENWNLPEAVHQSVRYQSAPDLAGENQPAAQLLALTRQVLASNGVLAGEPHDPLREAQLYEALALDREMAKEAITVIIDSSDELAQMATRMVA